MPASAAPTEAMDGEREYLRRILDYEIRAAARYRRFATLIKVVSAGSNGPASQYLMSNVRTSDELLDLKDRSAVILMGETDRTDALVAIRRYREKCGPSADLRFGLASYPADGQGAGEIMQIVDRRLRQAVTNPDEKVVCSG